MKLPEYNTLDKLTQSNLTEDLTKQTLQNIQAVQTPTQAGFIPQPVVLPVVESAMQRLADKDKHTMTGAYYILVNGNQRGPFTLQQVKEYVKQGVIQTSDYCWHQGMEKWELVECVSELA